MLRGAAAAGATQGGFTGLEAPLEASAANMPLTSTEADSGRCNICVCLHNICMFMQRVCVCV